MRTFTPFLASLLLSSTALAASNFGIMPRNVLLSTRQLQCGAENPNICEQTANSIKCGQNCCSDGTSCEFGYSCQSGGRCCDESKPLSQCGVATICYDASDARCPGSEECCPSSAPYCTYQDGRAICELSTTFTNTLINTNTIINTETSTNTITRSSTSVSTTTYSTTATSSASSSSSETKSSTSPIYTTYTSSSASSIRPSPTSIGGGNATAPNSTVSQPPIYSGAAAGREGFVGAGVVAVVLAVGGAFI